MASIESLGIGSGLLTSELVESIIEAERAPTELRLDRREAEVEAKITAYGEVRSALDKVQSAATGLASDNLIRGTTATSSDESALTATTNSTAEPGNYRVAVDQVASAHTLASKAYTSVSDTVGTGTLTFNFGTTTYDETTGDYTGFDKSADLASFSLDITSENNTLSGLRDTINKNVEGVTASLVFDGSGYRLLMSSDKTGEKSSLEIVATGDAGIQSLAYNSAQNDPNTNLRETQRGEDAQLRVNGLEITSASNQVSEVIRGVTINVNQETTGSINLNVNRNTGDVADKMEAFVEAFNEFKFVYDEVNKFDPDTNQGGLLLGDSTLRSTYSQLRSGLNTIVENLTGANFRSLADVGLETDQTQNFQFQFNRTKFEAALNANADAMAGLLARQQTATDSQIRYVTQSGDTKPGEYEIFIEKAATQAKWQGLSSDALGFGSAVVIGGSNDEFTLQLNGTQRKVSLEQGSYSNGDDLSLMLQSAINTAFVDSGQTATVSFDAASQGLSITSSRFGSASTVNVTSVDPTLASTLGLAPAGTGQVTGQNYSGLSDAAFAAATSPGTQAIQADQGMDFSANSVSFDLSVTGTGAPSPVTITLDEAWSDVLNTSGEVVTGRDRDDVLAYIQSELNNAGLTGYVRAEFSSADRLVFRTNPEVGAQSIAISNISAAGTDPLGLQAGLNSSGVTLADPAEFSLSYSNRQTSVTSADITVPAGTYETGEALAQAIQDQINADANVVAGAVGAETTKGSRVLAANVDFGSDPSQIQFNLNGSDFTLNVNSETEGSTLGNIQSAIDGALGSGVVTASLDGNGLVLTTNAPGSGQSLSVTKDGMGATTAAGNVDLSTGVDFSASPASFRLAVDGVDVDVSVDGDGTAGTNDSESNLAVIQQALDTGLSQAGGGGEFQAGDVKARLDDSGQLYFETLSKNGEPTLATYGASAMIELSQTAGAASLGLADQGPLINGADGFGLALGNYQGFDSQANVSYEQNDDGNGRFVVSFGNDTEVQFNTVDITSAAQLGFSLNDGTESEPARGQDVKGTINGVEATGRGQLLTAREGNEGATNGYLLGGTGADFSSPVSIDNSNNSLKVVIDGQESGAITLNNGVYTTGNSLAAELKRAINADVTLAGSNKAVDVQYDPATSTFGIFSVSKGADSSVRVSEIDAGAIDAFGFTTSTQGVEGKDAVGTKDPAAGLVLRVEGSATGDRGSVSLIEGIFARLEKTMNNFLDSTGLITGREKALERDMEGITEDRERLDARLEAQEKRLKAKFLFNDQIVSQLKTTEDFLSQQFEILAAGLTGKS
ncbi:flagellar filament capping protein FliD [Saccharospirillum impatiens]|uniref:flagellar filament capping protein FliD n=1 Tax=Saccharospirillum impatiens TaxID=169438 RepID=UPI0004075238|nr:flagellar filament capping protein FliD [Saccharospirillum impatiens]